MKEDAQQKARNETEGYYVGWVRQRTSQLVGEEALAHIELGIGCLAVLLLSVLLLLYF